MSEWCHDRGNSKRVRDLVDCTKPRANIRQAGWLWEGKDVLNELLCWFDSTVCDSEPKKVDFLFSKLKLLRIEGASTFGSLFQEPTDSEEVFLNCIIIYQTIIHTVFDIIEGCHDFQFSMGVSIPGTD